MASLFSGRCGGSGDCGGGDGGSSSVVMVMVMVARLQFTGSVEVLEGDLDTLGHGLLTLTDPDTWVVVPTIG